MDWNTIRQLWWGCIYDQQYETQAEDVGMLLSLLGEPKKVLEVCCGTGRVLVPLARAGHFATGFDRDSGMLARLPEKARGLENITWLLADAFAWDWGTGYDAVVLACNTIQNIDGRDCSEENQRAMIRMATAALRPGGHFYMTYDLYHEPEKLFEDAGANFPGYRGTDEWGVYGEILRGESHYDPAQRKAWGSNRLVLTLPGGETQEFPDSWWKFLLTRELVNSWLDEAGLELELECNGHNREPIDENRYNNVVVWARKRD